MNNNEKALKEKIAREYVVNNIVAKLDVKFGDPSPYSTGSAPELWGDMNGNVYINCSPNWEGFAPKPVVSETKALNDWWKKAYEPQKQNVAPIQLKHKLLGEKLIKVQLNKDEDNYYLCNAIIELQNIVEKLLQEKTK